MTPDDWDGFKARVRAALNEATREAYELLGQQAPLPPTDMRRIRGGCKGCGVPFDEYTPACVNCSARHSMRRTHGWADQARRSPHAVCVGCGGELDGRTRGCVNCKHRHSRRRAAARRRAKVKA